MLKRGQHGIRGRRGHAQRVHALANQVLDHIHLLHLALGVRRNELDVDAQLLGLVLRARLHLYPVGIVERLDDKANRNVTVRRRTR